MIIQCQKCSTRYRFDERLMGGEGGWVRCSRCRHVFFQATPREETVTDISEKAPLAAEPTPAGDGQLLKKASPEEIAKEETPPADKLPDPAIEPEILLDTDQVMDNVSQMKRIIKEEELNDLVRNEPELVIDEAREELEESEASRTPGAAKKVPKKKRKLKLGWVFAYIGGLIILVAGLVTAYLQFFPGADKEIIRNISQHMPIVGRLLGLDGAAKKQDQHQVRLGDLRQRFISNVILGKLRVVEGTLTNTGAYPLARIRVKGELLDDQTNLLGEMVIYCGNIMTDAELHMFSEEEILAKLNQPEGSNFSNNRTAPGELIPFMLVFVRESAGVAQTVVALAGAERLPD